MKNSNGIALLMVLWIIAILSVVALEFSFAMRTEVNVTKNFKEELNLYAIAEGGIERAIAELVYKHDPKVQEKRKGMKVEEVPPEKKEWVTDGRPYLLPFDQGSCEIKVMGEDGKININIVSEPTLRKVIGNLGLEGEAKDTVVDSILDWRDPDDLHRINGAENDYYQSLPEPYFCKDGNLDSIEELLLVRGVTPDLFYGARGIKKEGEGRMERMGLKDIFSVYSFGEQIDINSATSTVMRLVLGIPSEIGQQIIKAREEKPFETPQDLLQRVPELSPLFGEIGRFIIFRLATPYYTIESRTRNKEGGSVRGLKVIVKIDQNEKRRYKIIQWVDRLHPYE